MAAASWARRQKENRQSSGNVKVSALNLNAMQTLAPTPKQAATKPSPKSDLMAALGASLSDKASTEAEVSRACPHETLLVASLQRLRSRRLASQGDDGA